MRCAVRQFVATVTAVGLVAFATIFASPSARAEPVELDNAGLKQMLENMGYEPTDGKYPNGNPLQTIKGSTSLLNWTANLSVNPKTHLIWLEMDFWSLKGDQKFPYDVLLEALERNFHLNTVRFTYLKNSRMFRLAGSIPNHDVKPAQIRTLIEEAVNEAGQTKHLWNPNNWRVEAADDESAADSKTDDAPKEPEAVAAEKPEADEPQEPSTE